ncbi:competence type IV pilus ATPase ComGA [Lactobacillus kefiranofaciens]|uniref:competence type IV pilus ATPase ComGA n=1 Tax=Lactobacillus kefiranofaciens TaxID=267818 RepID=UPI00246889E8|nr:competence type IV pilus ATPase ComGA [Lactobacillus kefiranofaciens]MDH5099985.1 competence type IV pilus ATPase ComGA [Lactobacillus kefiranofaciens]
MKTKEIINELLALAISQKASDIFFFPKREKIVVDFRLSQGTIRQKTFALSAGQEIINYFKYSAQMDIAEHRRPQVGAMIYLYEEDEYYLRLSSLGDFSDQESLVIRIIYGIEHSKYFLPTQLEQIKQLVNHRGLIITSGPTGSGKTTTMYEVAKSISKNKVVMTIEDPVEVHEASFLQSQVNNKAGIDYQSLLKAALRHRPDILIIGEIRDQGTARLAVDAALSGHLVLATVHAKSTLQTISRLEGLGIRTDELANCLTAVSYQRLLPSKVGLKCLLDIATGDLLKAELTKEVRGEFVNWQENMQLLRKGGEIDEEIYRKFQEG